MPKSKSSSLESLEQTLDSEDTMSQCSSLSLNASLSEEPLKEDISSILDGLSEKRTETRELNLKKLKKLLGTQLMTEELENQIDTAQDALLKCLKKSKTGTETALAAQVLTLLYVTMGMDHDLRLSELREVLTEKLVSITSETVLTHLVYLFAIAHFISEDNPDQVFDAFVSKHAFSILAYGALSTLTDTPPSEKMLQFHLKCLTQPASVKVAAAENFALFHERGVLPAAMHAKVVHALTNEESVSVKQTAQHDRKLLKSMVPSVLATLENEAPPPEEKLQFGKQVMVLRSWEQQRQFELFRQALGSALQFHVLNNPLLQAIFDVAGSRSMSSSSLNKQEKKLYLNPSCEFNKQRTLARSKQRKQKGNRSNPQLWT